MLCLVWVPCDTWGVGGGCGGSRGTLSLVYILTWCQKKSSNMDKLQPPSALVLSGNLAENWLCFLAAIPDLFIFMSRFLCDENRIASYVILIVHYVYAL